MYTLIILDMQGYFSAAKKDNVKRNCRHEIIKAMAQNAPILFVEYKSCGRTISSLTKLTREVKYGKVYRVIKSADDGSSEIDSFIKKNRLPRKHIRFTGINTDCCVQDTVTGLDSMCKSDHVIEVVADACASEDIDSHKQGIKALRRLRHVAIV